MPRRVALVKSGTVALIAYGSDSDAQHQEWLAAVTPNYDRVDDVTDLGYGVNVGDLWTEENGYRAPQPYPSWTWQDGEWVPPTPRPQGVNYEWDEDAQEWVYTGPPKPTIVGG